MTISYQLDVSSASVFAFFRLLFRWKGSIWKIVYEELLVWTVIYLIIAFIYRSKYFLNEHQKVIFEELAYYLDIRLDYIPVTFILGFFVSSIVSRWSNIFSNMGYVESQAIFVGNYVQGGDKETRLLRRAIARYMCLTQALVFRDISVKVRKRFPTYDSLVQAGFATEEDKEKLESIKLQYDKYWAPTNWIYTLIFRARREGKISHDILASKLCDEIKSFRYNLQMVCNYDWVPLPLVYPQAVFLAVYVYFGICLISRQIIKTDRLDAPPNKSTIDLYLPIMTMIQFFFFIGWVKVAQGLLNSFGTDDDDFECNYLLDKNLATSMCIVDDECANPPEVLPDKFWHRRKVQPLYIDPTHTVPHHPLMGSAINAKLKLLTTQIDMVRRPHENDLSDGNSKRKMSQLSRIFPRLTLRRSRVYTSSSDQLPQKIDELKNKENITLARPTELRLQPDDAERPDREPNLRLISRASLPNSTINGPGLPDRPNLSPESDFVPPDPTPSKLTTNAKPN